jgi:hypothetical protein
MKKHVPFEQNSGVIPFIGLHLHDHQITGLGCA